MSESRHADVEYALMVQALRQLQQWDSEKLAAIGVALGSNADKTATTLHHIAAGSRRAHRAKVVTQIAELIETGRKKADAVHIVANRYQADKGNALELETLKSEYRRWVRDDEKRTVVRPQPLRRGKGSA